MPQHEPVALVTRAAPARPIPPSPTGERPARFHRTEWQYVTAVQGRPRKVARARPPAQGQPRTVTIFERRGVDTMSGRPHPKSVELSLDGKR